ncbi:hypothetical protein AHAS_Ahas12G0145000 [Arachis hypogaea]
MKDFKMCVENGGKTKFWEDVWVGERCLKNKFPMLYSISLQKSKLISNCGFWDGLCWNWNLVCRRRFFEWESNC